jgi:hypothetical protein
MLLAASFVWGPLFAASPKYGAQPIRGESQRPITNDVWNWVHASRLTDILLVCVGVGQLFVYGFQASRMRDQTALMERQSDISERQIDLAERAFAAQHLPILKIKEWYYLINDEEKSVTILIDIVNVGHSDAEVFSGDMGMVSRQRGLPKCHHCFLSHLSPFRVAAGKIETIKLLLKNEGVGADFLAARSTMQIEVSCSLSFRSKGARDCHASFTRHYDSGTQSFARRAGQDEY